MSTTTLVAFNDVRVPVENLLGQENQGEQLKFVVQARTHIHCTYVYIHNDMYIYT